MSRLNAHRSIGTGRLLAAALLIVLAGALVIFFLEQRERNGGAASLAERWPARAHVVIEQKTDGPWRLTYDFAMPVREVDVGPSLEGFRVRDWRVETDGVALVERDGRDYLVAPPDRPRFTRAQIAAETTPLLLAKEYQPFTPLGEDGVVLFTGHFLPWAAGGGRMEAELTLIAAPGARVHAFGEDAARFERWKSPYAHPAFVYFGEADMIDSFGGTAIVDAAAPEWIVEEFKTLAPALFARLQDAFGRPLQQTPSMFIAFKEGGAPGRLRYSGDALPAQFLITLSGGGWVDRSAQAVDLLRRASAHEAAHLWQTAARPAGAGVPDWIHEGAADAIGAEILVAARYWDTDDKAQSFARARRECGDNLAGRTLKGAAAEGAYRVVYACGHVLAVAAAGEGGVTDFWRELIARAARNGGYDEALFLALAEERAGAPVSEAIASFARTALARPDKSLDDLLRLAENASAAP